MDTSGLWSHAEEQLRGFLDDCEDLVEITSPGGRLLYANPAWLLAFGYQEGVMPEAGSDAMVIPQCAEEYHLMRQRLLTGAASERFEGVFATCGERRLVLRVRASSRMENGEVRHVRYILRDLTAQRSAENARARLIDTLDATTDFVAVANGRGRAEYINRAGRLMMGIGEKDDVRGIGLSGIYTPEARQHAIEVALPAALRDGVWQGESMVLTRDGKEIPVSVVVVTHRSPRGGVWFVSTIMRDISVQKQREAELKRLDQLKSEFVSTVSHELRTPLTSIRGSLGLLEGGAAGTLSPQGLDLVRIGRKNSERLIRLINDLLDLDKIAAGGLSLRHTMLMPADVVRVSVDGVRSMAEQFKIQIRERVDAHRSFRGDRDRVVQVLTNLLSNAIKFSPAGATVDIEAAEADDGKIRFAVNNPGAGIVAADLPKLFNRFQQLDSADNRQRGGTGLGLAISKGIVEQHGGEIGVASEPGVKTVFWFALPIKR